MYSEHQMQTKETNLAMLVTRIQNPNQIWLMILSLSPYDTNLVENASMYLASGSVPYPLRY